MLRNMKMAAFAATAVLASSAAAQAATLGQWNFNDFANTATYAANNGPWTAAVTSPEASVSQLSQTGLSLLEASETRDNSTGPLGSPALLLGLSSTNAAPVGPNTPAAPASTTDYFAVSVTANQSPLNLTSLSFDLGTSAGTNQSTTEITTVTTYAQLFYSTDGGTTFNTIGAEHHSIADITGGQSAFTGMQTYTVDLTSISDLASTETVQFRLGVTDNRGGGSTSMASYWDNFVVEGTVVPEPGSLALAGIAGLGLLARRRRQA